MKLQPEVRRETVRVAVGVGILFCVENAVFLLLGKWDATVLAGSVFGSAWALANFVLLGITLQKASGCDDDKRAKSMIQFSYSTRLFGTGLVLLLGFILPCFHPFAVLPTALFQRVTILALQIIDGIKNRKQEGQGNG